MSDTDILEPDDQTRAEFTELMADPAARQAFVEIKAEKASQGIARSYSHVLNLVSETPWAIRPAVLAVIVDVLAFRAQGGRFTAEEIESRVAAARRPAPVPSGGGVAVLPIQGIIVPKADLFTEMSGGTSIETLRASFRDAMASSEVGSVVFDIDSPGGAVDQVPEMAAEIRSARGSKPIVAVANGDAASGAYWLASQADEIVVTKSGRVGSIGVVTVHEDHSMEEEMAGIQSTLLFAGRFKTEGNPFEPLSDEARVHIQSLIDEFYSMFVSDVAKGRGVSVQAVRDGFGQGRVVSATTAVSEGMADRIDTIDNVILGLLRSSRSNQSQPAAMAETGDPEASTTTEIIHTESPELPAGDEPEPQPEAASTTTTGSPDEIRDRRLKAEIDALTE